MSELQPTTRPVYPAGSFCWADLGTPDPEGAKQFYTELFGWSVLDAPMGDGSFYTMLRQGERDVAALYPQTTPGVPPSWLVYISVDSADHGVARARSLGAEVLMEPFDVLTSGRMGVIRDPSGAVVALWEGRDHPGSGVFNEPGALCWFELMSSDPDRAAAFYPELLGWTASEMEMDGAPYTLFSLGEQWVGGMMRTPEQTGPVPSHWLPYVMVEDCDAVAARAGELGGTVPSAPADIPGIGRFAVLRDPQGATLCVIAMEPPAP